MSDNNVADAWAGTKTAMQAGATFQER